MNITARTGRRLAAAIVGCCAILLPGAALAAPAAPSAPARAIVPGCETPGLVIWLQIVNVLNFTTSRCQPVTAAGFRVFPPNQTRAKVVPFPFGACSASGPVYMFVRPVTK